MSCQKYWIVVALLGICAFVSTTSAQTTLSTKDAKGLLVLPFQAVDADSSLIRGQHEEGEKKAPNFFDRMKKTISNWAKDKDEYDEYGSNGSPQDKVQGSGKNGTAQAQAIPMTPPKPVTTDDIRRSIDQPESTSVRRTSPPLRSTEPVRENSIPAKERDIVIVPQTEQATETAGAANSDTIYGRMAKIREQVFVDGASDSAPTPAVASRQQTTPPAYTPRSVPQEPVVVSPSPVERRPLSNGPTYLHESASRDSVAAPSTDTLKRFQPTSISYQNPPSSAASGNPWESNDVASVAAPSVVATEEMKPLSGVDVGRTASNNSAWWNNDDRSLSGNRNARPQRPQETVHRMEVGPGDEETSSNHRSFTDEREAFPASPLIELDTLGASKVIVGQEATYQIRVLNRGGAAAEQVVLTVEIPNWIDVLPPDVSVGTTSIVSRGPNSDVRDFVWKIAKVESRSEERIVMHLVPKQRQTVDLKIKYDFHKPLKVAKIIVQEPTLEMELQGPGEVLWGSKVNYKLMVRNTGNGDAENVKLELLQTGSDMKSCEIPLLKAGEEQMIDVDVWTGKQDHVDINIQATGAYDLSANVLKRVVVMRPDLNVRVEAPEMQFIGNPAEFTVRVQNKGNATAKNVELAATIPLGAKYVSNTAGGRLTPQNQVVWNVDAIPGSGEFVATIVCEMKREGLCKLEAAVSDKSGVLASNVGNINIEAIADLKMQLENPQGPIEVGQEAVFVITVSNRGTKTAEDVEVVAAFARGLEPFGIEGANGMMNDGQVVFDKIPTLNAGQTITLKVKGKADRPGNHRIRAEVICAAVNAHLVYEQATYFYQKGKTSMSAEAPSSSGFGVTETPITPSPLAIQGNAPQPLQSAPASATRGGSPLR